MASRRSDQSRVAELARSHPSKVIPAFGTCVLYLSLPTISPCTEGYHPWFSHLISLEVVPDTPEAKEAHYRSLFLPDNSKNSSKENNINAFNKVVSGLPHPFPLPDLISMIRGHLTEFMAAHQSDPAKYPKPMLGEVGLDRSFRVPFSAYRESEPPEPEDGPKLTPFFVPIEHQETILKAQLDLAIEIGVNVSLHSVKAPAQTQAVFKQVLEKHGSRFDAISVDMHSCGVSVDAWKDIEVCPSCYICVVF
jgi:Tat protein secretion system quality control protein TatD with DNase activity